MNLVEDSIDMGHYVLLNPSIKSSNCFVRAGFQLKEMDTFENKFVLYKLQERNKEYVETNYGINIGK